MPPRRLNAPKGTRRVMALYKGFRERNPERARVVRIKLPQVAMLMGFVRAIEYDTTLGYQTVKMRHDFARGSAPQLAAGRGRNKLLLVGGRYHVTSRGIVDLTPRGREIDDHGYKSRRQR